MWCTLYILQRDKQGELYFSRHKWSTIWRHPAAASRNSSNWRRDLPLHSRPEHSKATPHATTGTTASSTGVLYKLTRMQFSTKKVNRSIHVMLATLLQVAQTAGLQFSPDLPCHARNKIPANLWFRDLNC